MKFEPFDVDGLYQTSVYSTTHTLTTEINNFL